MKQVPMLNLKLEYEYMKRDIDSHVEKCFQHQNWILGPELKTLEPVSYTHLTLPTSDLV